MAEPDKHSDHEADIAPDDAGAYDLESYASRTTRKLKLRGVKHDEEYFKKLARGLSYFDFDGDGVIDVEVLKKAADDIKRHKKEALYLKRGLLALLVVLCIQWAAVFGLVFAVVVLTKDSYVKNVSDLAPQRGSQSYSAAVQAFADQPVLASSSTSAVIATSSFAQPHGLSSVLPDSAFMSLGTLTISSNATDAQCLSFTVDGFLRVRGQGRFGSVVKIFTRLGMVTIDGRDLLWDAQAQAVLADAGFSLVGTGPQRRLLDLGTDIVGFFNRLASFDLDALEAEAARRAGGSAAPRPPAAVVSVPPPLPPGGSGKNPSSAPVNNATVASGGVVGIPTAFSMSYKQYFPCAAPGDPLWCGSDDGGYAYTERLEDAAAAALFGPNSTGRFFTTSVDFAANGARTIYAQNYSYASHVDFSASNGTMLLTASLSPDAAGAGPNGVMAAAGWVNCDLSPIDNTPVSVFGWITAFGLTPSAAPRAPGAAQVTVRGQRARHFIFTNGNATANPFGLAVHYFDAADAPHYPLRFVTYDAEQPNVPNNLIDVLSFAPLPANVTAPDDDWEGPGSFDQEPVCVRMDLRRMAESLYPPYPLTDAAPPAAVLANPAPAAAAAASNAGRRRGLRSAALRRSLLGNLTLSSSSSDGGDVLTYIESPLALLVPGGMPHVRMLTGRRCDPVGGVIANKIGMTAISKLIGLMSPIGIAPNVYECVDGTIDLEIRITNTAVYPGVYGMVDVALPQSGKYYVAGASGMAVYPYGQGCMGFSLEAIKVIRDWCNGPGSWLNAALCAAFRSVGLQLCYATRTTSSYGYGVGATGQVSLLYVFTAQAEVYLHFLRNPKVYCPRADFSLNLVVFKKSGQLWGTNCYSI